ncbi:tyrosinase family protein, partial [Mycobacterium tuberculosis]
MGAGGALAVGGPALAQTGGAGAPTSVGPIRVRRNVSTLPANDPNLLALARAMKAMQARDDGYSWQTQIDIHATYWGQHGTWRFLPWHRCQLFWFERIVARLSGKADFAMPYWDWQDTGKLPAVFLDPSS